MPGITVAGAIKVARWATAGPDDQMADVQWQM